MNVCALSLFKDVRSVHDNNNSLVTPQSVAKLFIMFGDLIAQMDTNSLHTQQQRMLSFFLEALSLRCTQEKVQPVAAAAARIGRITIAINVE